MDDRLTPAGRTFKVQSDGRSGLQLWCAPCGVQVEPAGGMPAQPSLEHLWEAAAGHLRGRSHSELADAARDAPAPMPVGAGWGFAEPAGVKAMF